MTLYFVNICTNGTEVMVSKTSDTVLGISAVALDFLVVCILYCHALVV